MTVTEHQDFVVSRFRRPNRFGLPGRDNDVVLYVHRSDRQHNRRRDIRIDGRFPYGAFAPTYTVYGRAPNIFMDRPILGRFGYEHCAVEEAVKEAHRLCNKVH